MIVFEIVTPGTRLDHEDCARSFSIEGQLGSLVSLFFEANVALNLFMNAVPSPMPDLQRMEGDTQRYREIHRAIEVERAGSASSAPADWEHPHVEAGLRFKRERWANGHSPAQFEQQKQFLYARAFLYALDGFHKFLGVLAKEGGVPPEVDECRGQLEKDFPDLRGVRNTAQHLEDRSRGLGPGKNPIPLKPVSNRFVDAPHGGVLILNNLYGTRYGSTMADGHYGEIDVSAESMRRLKRILERVLQSFKWIGPKQYAPSA